MKIPLSLIKSYLHLDEPLSTLSETLTLLGIEVDAIENETPRFKHIVAVTVVSTTPHPSADKLQIARVHDGAREWQVVCGAKNCRSGLKTAFAKAGVGILYDANGRELRIEATKIRDIESHGMLCSAEELGIPGDDSGILELPADLSDGQDLTSLLWDPVLELSLTPNLGHCMSALGVARELSAALNKPLRSPKVTLQEHASSQLQEKIEVNILDENRCSRYACRLIEHVSITPSPFWLQKILLAAGMRPVNNVVDITNYILIKTGQPLHAFDANKIEGGVLSVQTTESVQHFVGLDGVERKIPLGTLVICDAHKILALAGIMGGANSSVSDSTTSVLVEAACFDPVAIRKTSRALSLRTESSHRFEKGIDANAIGLILDEACALLAQESKGQIAQGVIDQKKKKLQPREINLRQEKVNSLLGTRLSLGEIEHILQRLGCKTHTKEQALQVIVPLYRNDIGEEVDLIEEVARIYGYNKIEKRVPLCSTSLLPHAPLFLFEQMIRRRMTGQGLQEILTCDLISPRLAELSPVVLFGSKPEDRAPLKVLHAKTEEYSILRSSLLPGVLEVIRANLDQKNQSLSAFELGHIYLSGSKGPSEIPMLAVALYGTTRPPHFAQKPREIDFYDLKGILESLFEALHVPNIECKATEPHPSFHPGRQAHLHANGLCIGTLGELHPELLSKLPIKERVLYAEINVETLMDLHKEQIRMTPLPQYPSTTRDWTITLPDRIDCEQLFSAINDFHDPLLAQSELIDLYVFEQNATTKRNATLRFTYRDLLKTISFEEAETVHAKLLAHLSSALRL